MLSFKSIWSEMTLKAYPVMGNENVWLSKKKKDDVSGKPQVPKLDFKE